jgi:hypothetical protein
MLSLIEFTDSCFDTSNINVSVLDDCFLCHALPLESLLRVQLSRFDESDHKQLPALGTKDAFHPILLQPQAVG